MHAISEGRANFLLALITRRVRQVAAQGAQSNTEYSPEMSPPVLDCARGDRGGEKGFPGPAVADDTLVRDVAVVRELAVKRDEPLVVVVEDIVLVRTGTGLRFGDAGFTVPNALAVPGDTAVGLLFVRTRVATGGTLVRRRVEAGDAGDLPLPWVSEDDEAVFLIVGEPAGVEAELDKVRRTPATFLLPSASLSLSAGLGVDLGFLCAND